ncbi:MAG: trehalase family glycosidase [Acidobacteriota bacterium]
MKSSLQKGEVMMDPQPAKWVRNLTVSLAALLILSCLSVKVPMAFSENPAVQSDPSQDDLKGLLHQVDIAYARLQPQTLMPAEGYLKHDFLIPAGFYKQMWDWDGFFIGNHLMNQSTENAKYLKWWVLNFADSVDSNGYVSGCITTQGPRPIFGKFAMKPFLSQGAYLVSMRTSDFGWLKPIYDRLKAVISYREATEYDPKYGLFYWDIGVQSGADNNPAVGNDDKDRDQVMGCDINTFQLREYEAMAAIAKKLGISKDIEHYYKKAAELKGQMVRYLWFKEDESFFNVRRDNGKAIKCVSYSNFVPLIERMLPRSEGRAMIEKYLLSKNHLLAQYGFRSLSKQDPNYNNRIMIIPYSNWQGPIWINANYLDIILLKNYGFNQEPIRLAKTLAKVVLSDINTCGSMHECYDADTGAPLAPTAEESPNHVFTGFVGWNLLVQDMLQGAVSGKWMMLDIK